MKHGTLSAMTRLQISRFDVSIHLFFVDFCKVRIDDKDDHHTRMIEGVYGLHFLEKELKSASSGG